MAHIVGSGLTARCRASDGALGGFRTQTVGCGIHRLAGGFNIIFQDVAHTPRAPAGLAAHLPALLAAPPVQVQHQDQQPQGRQHAQYQAQDGRGHFGAEHRAT